MSNSAIFKYPLSVTDQQEIALPLGAKILDVQFQHGVPCLWALVDKSAIHKTLRTIHIFGTGNPMPDDMNLVYISTVQRLDGYAVWHVFEEVTVGEY